MRALVLEDPPWRDWEPPKAPEPEKEGQERPNPMRDWITSLEKMSVEELIANCRKDNPAWAEAELRPWAESKKQFDYNFLQEAGQASSRLAKVYPGNPLSHAVDYRRPCQRSHCPPRNRTTGACREQKYPCGACPGRVIISGVKITPSICGSCGHS